MENTSDYVTYAPEIPPGVPTLSIESPCTVEGRHKKIIDATARKYSELYPMFALRYHDREVIGQSSRLDFFFVVPKADFFKVLFDVLTVILTAHPSTKFPFGCLSYAFAELDKDELWQIIGLLTKNRSKEELLAIMPSLSE